MTRTVQERSVETKVLSDMSASAVCASAIIALVVDQIEAVPMAADALNGAVILIDAIGERLDTLAG